MKRVAVYGGSFNPIHRGHTALARAVIDRGLADEVWLMVSPCNPLKNADGLLPADTRLRMCRLAVADCPDIVVSDFETRLPLPSYTYLTLRALRAAFPSTRFSLLIGGDNWAVFPRWSHPEEILRNHSVVVYPRPGSPIDAATLPPGVSLLDAPLFPYSSTDVRNRLAEGGDISQMVVPAVADFIKEEGPYGSATCKAPCV